MPIKPFFLFQGLNDDDDEEEEKEEDEGFL